MKKVDFDSAPEVVGGLKQVVKNLKYPDKSRKAGVEGDVVVAACINKEGKMTDFNVQKSLNNECDKAAIVALYSVKWKPALKDKKPVTAWVSIPLKFKFK